jgi:cell division protein FtsI/penicillin-binding protein 2
LAVVTLAIWPCAFAQAEPESYTVLNKKGLTGPMTQVINQLGRQEPLALQSSTLGKFLVATTLSPDLQRYCQNLLGKVRDRRAAVVVIEADSGRVLALGGVRNRRLDPSVALSADGPAASLFKVVTAVAALEETNLTPDSRLAYVGGAHTLHRYQVKARPKRKGHLVTLTESFAKSNNPIFARLGLYRLGEESLNRYSRALGFERELKFELPLTISRLGEVEDSFSLAQMACGYHRSTTTTPVHAALLAGAVINGGLFMEPYVVERASTPRGKLLYQGKARPLGFAMSFDTSQAMRRLFQATITHGTARKAFRRLNRDRILKHLEIGGKTGTLRGVDRTELYEWFAGYGLDPETERAVAVCTMVVHGKKRYSNARELARQTLHQAFKEDRARQIARREKSTPNM